MTQSALSMRLCGMLSGMSIISFRTVPAVRMRSCSVVVSSAWESAGLKRVGRPTRAAISRAERALLFIRCTLLWVDGHHMDFTDESQEFSGVAAGFPGCHIIWAVFEFAKDDEGCFENSTESIRAREMAAIFCGGFVGDRAADFCRLRDDGPTGCGACDERIEWRARCEAAGGCGAVSGACGCGAGGSACAESVVGRAGDGSRQRRNIV